MKLVHLDDLPRPVGLGMPVIACEPGLNRIGRIEDFWVEGEGFDADWQGIIVWFLTLDVTMRIEWEDLAGPDPFLWFVDDLPWSEKVIGDESESRWGFDEWGAEMEGLVHHHHPRESHVPDVPKILCQASHLFVSPDLLP